MKDIKTSQCVNCENSVIDDENPKRISVYCQKKEKSFQFGQRILCDDYREK